MIYHFPPKQNQPVKLTLNRDDVYNLIDFINLKIKEVDVDRIWYSGGDKETRMKVSGLDEELTYLKDLVKRIDGMVMPDFVGEE